MLIKPFAPLVPGPDLAQQLASVPYDTIDRHEAREMGANNPYSFLRVTRPEITLPEGTDIYAEEVYEKAKENMSAFRSDGVLSRSEPEGFFVYRLACGDHFQSGIVACVSSEDYLNGLVKKHEMTRVDKEEDRLRHLRVLQANTSPVLLTYRDNAGVDAIVAATERDRPMFDFQAVDGVRHQVWRVRECAGLQEAFAAVSESYIADGHHRAASAGRLWEQHRSGGDNGGPAWFMALLFPAGQLRVLPYNRCVTGLNGHTPETLVNAIGKVMRVKRTGNAEPAGPRQVCMYVMHQWYLLEWDEDPALDPVDALDVSILQSRVLSPLLGIQDPRSDGRISFVGGARGTSELVRKVDGGAASAAFSMFPVSVYQMMAVADAGRIMPPKSTWFDPKPRSGLIIRTF